MNTELEEILNDLAIAEEQIANGQVYEHEQAMRICRSSIEKICPLCGKPNNCMAELKERCWCNDVKIPLELLERVPDALKRKSCICIECITKFKQV